MQSSKLISLISRKKEDFWLRQRERSVLKLFHEAAIKVPAYKDFLRRNKIKYEKIKNLNDFRNVPPTGKNNYLRNYSFEKLSWNGTLKKGLVFTSTSGSTGEPFYFPRNYQLDWQASVIHELFFRNNIRNFEGPTLILVCFGMGVWIGGLITYQSFEIMREHGYPVSILTPGINKQEIFKALRKLGNNFRQIILVGYAPFLKDVIDEANHNGVNVKTLNLRLIFAAESFTEKFRDYLARKANLKNSLLDTMNIYGSADIGAMAFESPLSIMARRLIMSRSRIFADAFRQIQRTPTLTQYIPNFICFEEDNGELFLTGDNAIPLIKYQIGDHGGVFSYNELYEKLKNHGIDLLKEARTHGIANYIYQLPFVYVYERIDFSTTLYGLQIYPETIREVLIENPMHKYLTGKLTLITKFDRRQDQYLEINLETRKHRKVPQKIAKIILVKIVANLRLKNSEFRELSDYLKKRAWPKLVFWPAEHPLYFKPGIKQRWVKK